MRVSMMRKIGLLGSLYFSQGLPFGFFTQALPIIMRNRGYSLEEIGFSTVLAIPWALKFLWAPAIDRFRLPFAGRRKSWIVPLQFVNVMILAVLACCSSPDKMGVFFAAIFFVNLASATQDIAADGLAVDILEPGERGLANGVQVAGYRMGMILGGGGLLILYETLGWNRTFAWMAILVFLASLPAFFMREPVKIRDENRTDFGLAQFFRRPGTRNVLALIIFYKIGDSFALGMLRPFLLDTGFTMADIGRLLGTFGFVAGLLGALTGGALLNTLGRKNSLIVFGFLQAFSVGGYTLLSFCDLPSGMVCLVCSLEHFTGGMATAALFTCMMDWCRPETGGIDYTIQACAVVIASGLAATISGLSAGAFGYSIHFALATLLAVAAPISAHLFYPGQPARNPARKSSNQSNRRIVSA